MDANYPLNSNDRLTKLIKDVGITSWSELLPFIQSLPYGRNKNRTDFALVISEGRGTCSSKHALLKTIADINKIPQISLILGIYKMNQANTPKIGNVLSMSGIDYLPEAHCYLKINGHRQDFTTRTAQFEKIENDLLEEIEIAPNQVVEFKIDYHKAYITQWLATTRSDYNFEQIWKLREQCIQNLTA